MVLRSAHSATLAGIEQAAALASASATTTLNDTSAPLMEFKYENTRFTVLAHQFKLSVGAGGGIRTHEPLRDRVLSPAPLTWLGNPRVIVNS